MSTDQPRPSVTDNARAAMHPVVTEHQIIGTQTGKQGAGQVVPEDSVLCVKCGWMRCSDYTWHLSDALAAGRAETSTATDEDVFEQVIDVIRSERNKINNSSRAIARALRKRGLLATAPTDNTKETDR